MMRTGGSKCAVRANKNSCVAAESRMGADQLKGGAKISNGGVEKLEADDKTGNRAPEQTRSSPRLGSAVKRKTGKLEINSFQIAGERSPSQPQKRGNAVAVGESNGICKSPVESQRKKSLNSVSDGGDQRSVILVSNGRSDLKFSNVKEKLEASGSNRSLGVADHINSAEEKKSSEEIGGCDGEIEKGLAQPETEKARSDEVKEDGDEGEDSNINGYDLEENEEEEVEETMDEEIEIENISCDEKEMTENEKKIYSNEEVADIVEDNISDCEDKEMDEAEVDYSISSSEINSIPKLSSKHTIATARSNSSAELSPVKNQPPKFSGPTHSSPGRDSDAHQGGKKSHSTLQNLVDLVMWKHVPKSALVFGVGSFLIISSSYTKDLNISFISVTSYLGLIYLGISVLYRSFKCRSVKDGTYTNYCDGMVVIGEEEAIWLSRFILPILNEFLLKLKALFSGDPAVTMKLAAVLFALARCGSSITLWNMVKLGFFAAFILPKFCSSYSAQITGYAKFWILRFEDAWRSCSHKKVVAFAIFTIFWNLSSVVARMWAAFMLFVAIQYYQQSTVKADSSWDEVEVSTGATSTDNYALRRRAQLSRKLRQGRPSSTTPIITKPINLKEAKKGL